MFLNTSNTRNMYPHFPTHYAGVPPPPPGNHNRLPGNSLTTPISSSAGTYRLGLDSRSGLIKQREGHSHQNFIHQGTLHQPQVVPPKGILRSPSMSTSKSTKQNRVKFMEPARPPKDRLPVTSYNQYQLSGKPILQSTADKKPKRSNYQPRLIVASISTASRLHHLTNDGLQQSKNYNRKNWRNKSQGLRLSSRQSNYHHFRKQSSSSFRRRSRKH